MMETIKCAVCGRRFSSSGPQICPICMKHYRALIRKLRCIEYLGGKCVKCGRTDEAVLTFHHTDPATKNYNIGEWIGESPGYGSISFDEVKRELDKCVVMCYSCHRLEHYQYAELKDYLPYLTKIQRRELEADIIHDAELLSILNDDEAIADTLMLPKEIEPTSPRKIREQVQLRIEESIKKLTDAANDQLEKSEGGILGIVPSPQQPDKGRVCHYCGETFHDSDDFFCSDFCAEQAREDAIEAKRLNLLEEVLKNGCAATCQRHGWKRKQLRKKLNFLVWD